jgi:hypothetical protein
MKTAVEFLASVLSQTGPITEDDFNSLVEQAKEMEKEQKIKMLNTFLCNAQMGEDVEDVEAWFEDYEKKQEQVKKELTSEEIPESFFKPVLCETIWNVTNRTTKQQEQ